MVKTMEIKRVPLDSIIPYAKNPRKNDAAAKQVAQSIRECGYCNPIIVDENMVILAGHTRAKALKILGWTECDIIVRDGLTEEQKTKYRLYDNKTGEIAEWDAEKLIAEMEDLDFSAFDLDWNLPLEMGMLGGDDIENREFNDSNYAGDEFDYVCPCCGYAFNRR